MANSLDWIEIRPPEPGEAAKQFTVVGTIPCHVCGTTCNVKVNKGGKLYSYCNGEAEASNGMGCNSQYRWGGKASKQMIAKWAATEARGKGNGQTDQGAGHGEPKRAANDNRPDAANDNRRDGGADRDKRAGAERDWFREFHGD